jgi:hypothetical protein
MARVSVFGHRELGRRHGTNAADLALGDEITV